MLVLIAPIVVNIVAYHVFLDPLGLGLAIVVVALEVYLGWAYRAAYRPLFAGRTTRRDILHTGVIEVKS